MSNSIETPLCALLGIRYPILSVGFADSAVPELVAAVSNAGGAGVLGASGSPPEEIRRRIARTRELTGRPFGIDFIIDERGDVTDEDKAYLRTEIATAAADLVRDAEAALGTAPQEDRLEA